MKAAKSAKLNSIPAAFGEIADIPRTLNLV